MTARLRKRETSGQTLDYGELFSRFRELFTPRRQCVAIADVDSLVTALILSQVLDWTLVGIYAPPALFLAEQGQSPPAPGIEGSNAVFIGRSICRTDVPSIARGVLKWGPRTPTPFDHPGLCSLNPDLLHGVSWRESRGKFPFGLSCFVLCCLAHWKQLGNAHWPARVAPLLLYAGRGYAEALRHPDSAQEWLDWMQADRRLASVFPLAEGFQGLNLQMMFNAFLGMSNRLLSLGVPERTQSLDVHRPSGWTRLYDLLCWIQDLTGLAGQFEPIFKRPRLVFPIQTRTAAGSLSAFLGMIEEAPFTYRIRGWGPRALTWDHIVSRHPATIAPAALA